MPDVSRSAGSQQVQPTFQGARGGSNICKRSMKCSKRSFLSSMMHAVSMEQGWMQITRRTIEVDGAHNTKDPSTRAP